MRKNITPKLIGIAVIIVLFIPIIMDIIQNMSLREIDLKEVSKVIEETNGYKFALVYADSSDKEETEETKKNVKEILENYTSQESAIASYYIDTKEISQSDLESYDLTEEGTYLFISNGEIIKTQNANIEMKLVESYIKEYTSNGIDESVKHYKVAEDSESFLKLVKRKKTITVAVFGRNNCYYCNQYLPVYNTVSEENDIDIYYFDSVTYDSDEYSEVLNSGLKIPASCSGTGEETSLSELSSTPLTIFTKNGKVIDCIDGYTTKAKLIAKFQTLGLIEMED